MKRSRPVRANPQREKAVQWVPGCASSRLCVAAGSGAGPPGPQQGARGRPGPRPSAGDRPPHSWKHRGDCVRLYIAWARHRGVRAVSFYFRGLRRTSASDAFSEPTVVLGVSEDSDAVSMHADEDDTDAPESPSTARAQRSGSEVWQRSGELIRLVAVLPVGQAGAGQQPEEQVCLP